MTEVRREGRVPSTPPASYFQAEYDGTPIRVPEERRSPVGERNATPRRSSSERGTSERSVETSEPSEPATNRWSSSERSERSVETTLDLTNAVGVGIDVVGIKAFAEQLDEPGTRFAQAFTPGERRAARAGSGSEAESLAARWAAKEAVIKAWSSTHFGHPEVIDPAHVDLREIEVRTDAWGRPAIHLHGAIADAMADYGVLVSLTHDVAADVAAAFVVLRGTLGV